MTALPSIPRLYTALAECLAVASTPCRWASASAKRPPSLPVRHGRWPECFFAGHGQRPAGVVDPLHGGSCGNTVFIPLGHPHHLPAGSGLCLRPGLRSGRAGGQRRVAAALLPLASAQRGRRPVTAASGGGLRQRFGCIWVLEHKHKSPKGISSSAEKRASWPSSWR